MGMTYSELSIFGRLRKVARMGPVSMFKALASQWSDLGVSKVAEKVKHFFRMYSINRHKQTVATPSMHAEPYNTDDNRFDLRPIVLNSQWTHQFAAIDRIVKE